jgi:response regulator of citrate/malate metabolism
MALVGYGCVSSAAQTLDVQLDKLKHCHKLFQEKQSSVSGRRLSWQQVAELQAKRQEGMLIRELMNEYGLSKASAYRYLRQHVEKHSTYSSD